VTVEAVTEWEKVAFELAWEVLQFWAFTQSFEGSFRTVVDGRLACLQTTKSWKDLEVDRERNSVQKLAWK
jgi:hypothetical protein